MYVDKIDKVYGAFLDWTMSLSDLIDTKTSQVDNLTMNKNMTEYHFGLRAIVIKDISIKQIDNLRKDLIQKLDSIVSDDFRIKLDFSIGSEDNTLRVFIVYRGTEPLAYILHDKDNIYAVFLDLKEAEKSKTKDQRVRALWESDFKDFLWDFRKSTQEIISEAKKDLELKQLAERILNAKIPKDK